MNRKLGLLLLIFVNALWGATYSVTKVALAEIPPTLLGSYRVVLATLLLWLLQIGLAQRNRQHSRAFTLEPMPNGDKLRLAGLGLLGVGLAYVIAYFGVNLTTATDASLMIIGEVMFTALLAAWWLKEHLSRWRMIGIGIGALGVGVLVLGHIATEGNRNGLTRALGDLLVLVALVCQAMYTVWGTALARKYQPLTVLTYAYTGSLLLWAPLLLGHFWLGQVNLNLSGAALFGILYLGVIASVFCYMVWFGVARHIGAGVSAISLFAQPVVGSLIGLIFLHDAVTPSLVSGAVLIFIALYLTTIKQSAPASPTKMVSN